MLSWLSGVLCIEKGSLLCQMVSLALFFFFFFLGGGHEKSLTGGEGIKINKWKSLVLPAEGMLWQRWINGCFLQNNALPKECPLG